MAFSGDGDAVNLLYPSEEFTRLLRPDARMQDWSPDGRFLLVTDLGEEIYYEERDYWVRPTLGMSLVDVETGEATSLSSLPDYYDSHSSVVFEPGGQFIVVGFAEEVTSSTYRINLDGTNEQSLGTGGAAAVSPDGTRIVVSDEDGLVLMDATGDNRQLIAAGTTGLPVWSPDGSSLAFGRMDQNTYDWWVTVLDLSTLRETSLGIEGFPLDWGLALVLDGR